MISTRTFRNRRHPSGAFTLIELLTVITIILILVGLVIGAAGYANTKAARARAEGEIRALGTVMENYKSDNGAYPRSTNTDNLDARVHGSPTAAVYTSASRDLFALLSGQTDDKGVPNGFLYPIPGPMPTDPPGKVYYRNYWGDLKPNMLGNVVNGVSQTTGTPPGVSAINDPYGLSYGYSTAYQKDVETNTATAGYQPTRGYNPTFDLWSVANKPTPTTAQPTVVKEPVTGPVDTTIRPVWIKNW